jgi:hypothetical protein
MFLPFGHNQERRHKSIQIKVEYWREKSLPYNTDTAKGWTLRLLLYFPLYIFVIMYLMMTLRPKLVARLSEKRVC